MFVDGPKEKKNVTNKPIQVYALDCVHAHKATFEILPSSTLFAWQRTKQTKKKRNKKNEEVDLFAEGGPKWFFEPISETIESKWNPICWV